MEPLERAGNSAVRGLDGSRLRRMPNQGGVEPSELSKWDRSTILLEAGLLICSGLNEVELDLGEDLYI